MGGQIKHGEVHGEEMKQLFQEDCDPVVFAKGACRGGICAWDGGNKKQEKCTPVCAYYSSKNVSHLLLQERNKLFAASLHN